MQISFESPSQADAIALITELDAYQSALYPPESHHALDLASVDEQGLLFVIARDEAGQAVACGAVVLSAAYGELKRMYVRPQYRGRGLAKKILQTLEAAAMASGCMELKLESGPYQPEALALYARCGYALCERFGGYADDPLSVFMQKKLTAPQDRDLEI
ncbi:GNAT family N-acetyltransferase [Undibacterium sp. Di27W]|uniref:GNAT family N-acetyltransferase n=1 Tax=Undibacterium sp. Di27W TaxID=3413036 RepID=UPI003BF07630